jgi:hypothetical protein
MIAQPALEPGQIKSLVKGKDALDAHTVEERAWAELINYAERNLENSDRFGESLTEYCRSFEPDYSRYFVPESMIPFHGTELWEALDEDQRILLSQVRYANFYNRVSSLENLACESNSSFAAQLRKNSSNVLRFYVNRETQEEFDHIWAFRSISRKVELHLFGEPVFDVEGADYDAQVNIKLFDRVRRVYRWMPRTMAMVTYAIRGLRNAALKTMEEAILQEEAVEPSLRKMTRMHFIDEARHTGMSYTVGKCMYEISGRSSLCTFLLERYLKNPQQGGAQRIKGQKYREGDVRNPNVLPRLLAHPVMKPVAGKVQRYLASDRPATPASPQLFERYLQRCDKNLEYLPEEVRKRTRDLLCAQRPA